MNFDGATRLNELGEPKSDVGIMFYNLERMYIDTLLLLFNRAMFK